MDISKAIPAHKVTRTFSKVFSFYCLHWVKDQATALSNIHRLLEADGEILLVFLARNPLFSAYRRLAEKDAWKGYMQVSVSCAESGLFSLVFPLISSILPLREEKKLRDDQHLPITQHCSFVAYVVGWFESVKFDFGGREIGALR